MNIIFHKTFQKKFSKLSKRNKEKFKERRNIFISDKFDPILNNHPLHGGMTEYRSINISGDLRAIYKDIDQNSIIFIDIDKHSNLYK